MEEAEMQDYKELVLAAVNQDGRALQCACEELKGDKEVVLAAVNQRGEALRYASEELKGDKEVVLAAVNQYGYALHHASEEMKTNKEVVLAVVKKSGSALSDASEELKGDKEVMLAAVNQDGYALQYASKELKEDKEVVLAAVNQSGDALQFALPTLRNGGLQVYVENLLQAHTVPSYVFLRTVLCGMKFPSSLGLGADDALALSFANDGDGGAPIARRSRTEASRACLLPKLNLGDATTVILTKKIAAFAGVQSQEFCGVPWSHVLAVAYILG